MTKTRIMAFAVAALVGIIASSVQAAVISVQPQIAGYFNAAFEAIPAPADKPGGGTDNTGAPTIVQIDVYMQVDQLLPGEDSFGTAAFSVQALGNPGFLGAAVPSPAAGGWAANQLGNTDTNGPAGGGVFPVIAVNGDQGTSDQDYQGILVQAATGAFTNALDQRRRLGEAGSASAFPVPLLLGSAFFDWNGTGQIHFALAPLEVSAKLTSGIFVAGVAPPSNILTIGSDIPEPSSLVLLGSCFAGLLLRRRAA